MPSEEAVLRILLEGAGQAGPAGAARPAAPPPSSAPPPVPTPAAPHPAGVGPPPIPKLQPWEQQAAEPMAEVMNVIGGFRGVLGGVLGPLGGALLDILASFRSMSEKAREARDSLFDFPVPQEALEPFAPTAQRYEPATTPALPEGAREFAPPTGEGMRPALPARTAGGEGQIPATLDVGLPEEALDVGGGAAAAGAAAAGPLAFAVVAAEAAHKLEMAFQQTIKDVGKFGEALISADADVGHNLQNMGQAMSEFGEKTWLLLPGLSNMIGEVGAVTDALGGLMDALTAVANRYAAYSPEIAVEQAMADVRQTFGDIRRAQEAGPDLANFIREQASLQQEIEDTKIELLREMAPTLIDCARLLKEMAPGIALALKTYLAPLVVLQEAVEAIRGKIDAPDDIDWTLPGFDVLSARPFRYKSEGSGQAP